METEGFHAKVGAVSEDLAESRIDIHALRASTIIGVHPEEREQEQQLLFDLRLYTDFTRAAQTDDLTHSVDYDALSRRVIVFVNSSSFRLLETVAARVIDLIFEEERIDAATVTVTKPAALHDARAVSVTLHRRR